MSDLHVLHKGRELGRACRSFFFFYDPSRMYPYQGVNLFLAPCLRTHVNPSLPCTTPQPLQQARRLSSSISSPSSLRRELRKKGKNNSNGFTANGLAIPLYAGKARKYSYAAEVILDGNQVGQKALFVLSSLTKWSAFLTPLAFLHIHDIPTDNGSLG